MAVAALAAFLLFSSPQSNLSRVSALDLAADGVSPAAVSTTMASRNELKPAQTELNGIASVEQSETSIMEKPAPTL